MLTLLSLLFLRPFLDVMQTPSDLIELSHSFLKAMFGGMIATILYNYLSSSIRALGDSKTPLYALMVAVVVNVGLDFVFILNFGWGVFGAGFATILSQLLSVVFLLVHIRRKLPQLQIGRADLRLDKAELLAHLKLGLPMGFQLSIIAIGAMTLQYALNQLGTAAIAAQAIASRTDQLAMLPIMNLGIAISTFTAQNYGAKQYQRILEGVKQSTLLAILWSMAFATVLLLGNRFFSALFLPRGSQEIFDLALTYYTINGLCYWIVAILFILRGMLQGLGKSVTTTLGGVMELIFRALVALLGLKYIGFAGVAAAHPAAWIGALLIFVPATYVVRKQFKQRSA